MGCVIHRTLIQGDKKGGFTIFWADDGLDTGPILLQRETFIDPDDTVDTLYNRFMFPEGIKAMVSNTPPSPPPVYAHALPTLPSANINVMISTTHFLCTVTQTHVIIVCAEIRAVSRSLCQFVHCMLIWFWVAGRGCTVDR